MINRRLSLRSQLCAAMAFLADGGLAERALNRAFPLDREHKRLARAARIHLTFVVSTLFLALAALFSRHARLPGGDAEGV